MKIMALGSGTDRIGKTGELDRFSVQALRFLKKEGHEVVWVDDNPVTLSSALGLASRVFLEPLTLKMLEGIIAQERPDSIMHCTGGCLATHLAIFLDREGILDRYGVRVLGTPVPALKRFMDAEIFKKGLRDSGVPLMDAAVVHNVDECFSVSRSLGFPLILRPAFASEGIGGYLAYNVEEVKQLAQLSLNLSPVHEVFLERAPADWVQFAIEAIHDPACLGEVRLVGTLEALDGGVGVHPGNSLVVAPAPTLRGELLSKALYWAGHAARLMEVCGSFQVRFALSPSSGDLVLLRVVHGLNRFSSLLAILHRLPLGEVNAGLSLGMTLEQLAEKLDLSGLSPRAEADLTVARIPVFPPEYERAEIIDTTMRSIGAAAFFGPTLSVSLAKALDFMCTSGFFKLPDLKEGESEEIVTVTSADKLLRLVRMLEEGEISLAKGAYMGFNPAFTQPLIELVGLLRRLRGVKAGVLPGSLLREAKVAGLSDEGIARLTESHGGAVGHLRAELAIRPALETIPPGGNIQEKGLSVVSYSGPSATSEGKAGALLILGPGPYRVGCGPELDLAISQTALALKERGNRIIIVNNNPDAVSLDLGTVDSICLETPTLEAIESLVDRWSIKGVIHQFCLDPPDGLGELLKKNGIKVLGTPLESLATIRHVPSLWRALGELGIPLLSHALAMDATHALREASELGYPLLVRLTDRLLNPEAEIMYDEAMFRNFLALHRDRISEETPVFMEIFQEGMIGGQVLAICDGSEALIVAFLENIEEYGIHSGDCASIIPALTAGDLINAAAEDALQRVVSHFGLVGHVQVELAIRGRHVHVTGLWPYPGRNLSFAAKATGKAIHPWVARLLLGEGIADLNVGPLPMPSRFYVKESVFPFSRFPGLDPVLSPRMQSTGQVLGADETQGKAYFKAQMAVNPKMPVKGKVFISARDPEKEAILQVSKKLLELGFSLVSTEGTAQFLAKRGIEVSAVHKVSGWRPNIIDLIINDEIAMVINIPGGFQSKQDEKAIHRATIEHNIPLITTSAGASLIVRGIDEIRRSALTIAPL